MKLVATYAYRERKALANRFRMGEGLVGQCALEKERILVTDIPTNYVKINSGLGEAAPMNIVVLPVLFEGEIKAVIELASFSQFNDIHLALLDQLTESIGIVLNTIEANMRTQELLTQSQSLTQELQRRQEELTETNRRLEQQAQSLRSSEELLKRQQEELQKSNEELEDKAKLLQVQNREVEQKNAQIELARRALEDKAEQLALTSKYKSEFLANMSHELRTPLNSMLILSKMLADNKEGNLSPKQIEYAQTVYGSGADLLALINEILDLAKIEAGAMTVDVTEVRLPELRNDLERTFRAIAAEKDLRFDIEIDVGAPPSVLTDSKRLHQVLINLLSNAFKFTESGRVDLMMYPVPKGHRFNNDVLNRSERVIAFAVRDTGIGIPRDKHQVIFEAFQQADGTTSRKYGGTGLGLNISREIAGLLGGEIQLQSEESAGSTFTLYLPVEYVPSGLSALLPDTGTINIGYDGGDASVARLVEQANNIRQHVRAAASARAAEEMPIDDDKEAIEPGDRVLLIVEDDPKFAAILVDLAREKGFKAIVAARGETGLDMARRYKPDAITLDIQLPGMHGLALLDRLKHDPTTRHIPVHIVSIVENLPRSRKMGAVTHLRKPVSRETVRDALGNLREFIERGVKRLLIIEDNAAQRTSIVELIGGEDVEITAVASGEEGLAELAAHSFDCIVVDLGLPDMSGFDLIEKIRSELGLEELPIVVYTARDLTAEESAKLGRLAEAVIVKDLESVDRLLDETALFLHRVESNLPEERRAPWRNENGDDRLLAGREVLIVDDDIRNIFALTSLLEQHDMKVRYAESGPAGIELLEQNPSIELARVDIKMPGLDGYEVMRSIRGSIQHAKLPIIAVTAKAMKGDREKCIEAGASDYITKPIDTEQLLSLLRVWVRQ
jgi:CheY-like chemotaxis protein/signal transduction histidine kinase